MTNNKIRSKIPTVQAWIESETADGANVTLSVAILFTVFYFFFHKHLWIPMLLVLVLVGVVGGIESSDCIERGICQ